ncbi:MAG: hypothetical protein ACPGPE_09225 [Planctomycetota bacterium]
MPVPPQPTWEDEALLAAIPAAAALSGEPWVLAVDPGAPLRPELVDFLARLEVTRVHWVGESSPPAGPALGAAGEEVGIEHVPCADGFEASRALLDLGWKRSRRVVLVDAGDADLTHVAATLAGRLVAPLVVLSPDTKPGALGDILSELETKQVVQVGSVAASLSEGAGQEGRKIVNIVDSEAAIRWLVDEGYPVDYLALANPGAEGAAPANALAAPALAAGRGGALVPLGEAAVWKNEHPTRGEGDAAGTGLPDHAREVRHGTLRLDQLGIPFVTAREGGAHGVRLDLDGDGRMDGTGEGPFVTGDEVELAGRHHVVDLDVDLERRGHSLWLTAPAPSTVQAHLALHRDACGGLPTHLCIVGWPEAVPPAIIAHGQGIDADLVSDAPYAQCDDDPFFEQGFGRIVAEDLPSATLIVARSLAYDHIRQRDWAERFATAEWEVASNEHLDQLGLEFAGSHAGKDHPGSGSPLVDVGLVRHASHSNWMSLGHTYSHDATLLLAPCLVESAGCSPASLDQCGPGRPSVVARLLRNGAIGFAGNSRFGIAQQALLQEAMVHSALGGASLGEAHRDALNRMLVAVRDRGQAEGGSYFYSLYGRAYLGDPALVLDLPVKRFDREAARVDVRGTKVTVHGPKRWTRVRYEPLEEWGCAHDTLYTWRGAGVELEERWSRDGNFNRSEHIFVCVVRTRLDVKGVELDGRTRGALGPVGDIHVDEHGDGTRTIYWRTRMLDVDETTGKVHDRSKRQRFRLVAR